MMRVKIDSRDSSSTFFEYIQIIRTMIATVRSPWVRGVVRDEMGARRLSTIPAHSGDYSVEGVRRYRRKCGKLLYGQ